MKTLIKTLTLVSVLISIALAGEGPFGIEFGTPPSSLNATLEGDIYMLNSVPKPHPYFKIYIVKATQSQGVYWIKGIGSTVHTSIYGEGIRFKEDELASQVASVYGQNYIKYDFLRSGSIWNEPEDWMIGLFKEERVYAYSWDSDNTDPFVSRKVLSVFIGSISLDKNSGAIFIEFSGTNYDTAKSDVRENQSSSF